MQVIIYKDHASLSAAAAAEITTLMQHNPDPVLCMASGETPRLTCRLFAERARKQQIDMRRLFFIGLDEWVGIGPENEGSCDAFFQQEPLKPLNLKTTQYHLFDSTSANLQAECDKMDAVVAERGIDLMIVGIGMNGHIGFNEPGVLFEKNAHVIELQESTITVGQKYFKTPVKLQKGITLGLKQLMSAKKVLLLANGIKKAEVVRKAIEEAISNQFPASIIQSHPKGIVMLDEEAASLLDKKN